MLDAAKSVEEGPVSEFHGMHETYGAGMLATFTRLTRRHDACFQVILPGYHREHCLLGGVSIAAGLARAARISVPAVLRGAPVTGRMYVFVTRHDDVEPRLQVRHESDCTPFFGVDVTQLVPGAPGVIRTTAALRPAGSRLRSAPVSQVPARWALHPPHGRTCATTSARFAAY